jgi:ADP-heptose:LPS heptosyltransferase
MEGQMNHVSNPRILVIARGHLGDLIGALPALRDLRSAYPRGHVTAMVNEYVRGALEGCPFVDDIVYGFGYRKRSLGQRVAFQAGVASRLVLRHDIAIALRMAPRSSPLIALSSGARVRVGYHQPGLAGRMLTHDLGLEPRIQSNRVTNLAPIRSLGIAASPQLPRLDWAPPAEKKWADDLLLRHGVRQGERFAVFQIAAHWGCYEWRTDKWAAVADHLSRVHGLRVVVVGTGEDFERQKFSELTRQTQVPLSLQGETSLPMLFHVVSRAALVVSADSALTQIALAQRVPAVILFGIEPMVRNGPLPDDAGGGMECVQHWEGPELAPTPNPHCRFGESHCHSASCRENSSYQRITVREVCDRADRVLEPGLVGPVSTLPAS